jgi:hypothetical protein
MCVQIKKPSEFGLIDRAIPYLLTLGLAEAAFYLKTEAESSLRNVVLNKNSTMDNAQNVNNCTDIP